MAQAQVIATATPATQKPVARPTLSLVTDIYDPDPAMLFEAQWRFNDALPYIFGNEDAANIVSKSMLHVLWLVENPFNADSKLKPAKKTFYNMLARFEREHGKGNLPERVFKRARWLGLIGSERSSESTAKPDPETSVANRAVADAKKAARRERDRAARLALKGPSGGAGNGRKSKK